MPATRTTATASGHAALPANTQRARPAGARRLAAILVIAAVLVLGACSSDSSTTSDGAAPAGSAPNGTTDAAAPPTPLAYAGHTSEVYADPAHWLCRPDLSTGPCTENLDATVVAADGSTSVERHNPARDPNVDCFYVYPTISQDRTANSDLEAGPEENGVALLQVARYNQLCRAFAPVYRQNTLASLLGSIDSPLTREERGQIAYDDVLDAWKTYIAQDNGGRGVILVGHSQGSGMLSRLIREEIDPTPALREHLISAYLLGTTVSVPDGADVGGDYQNVPTCSAVDQVGCVVSYASFRSTAPPPTDSLFGRTRDATTMAACVNPAAPGGGSAPLTSYFTTASISPTMRPDLAAAVATPFVKTTWLVAGECVDRNDISYLELTVNGGAAAPITDVHGDLTAPWGMHLIDADVTMGDQLTMAAAQSEAWLTRN